MEEVRTKGRGGLIFIIFLLILIISALVGYILIDKEIVKVPGLVVVNKEQNAKENKKENKESLNVDNPNVLKLFSYTRNYYDSFGFDQFIYNTDKVSVKDLDEDYKLKLAINVYAGEIEHNFNLGTSYVSYDAVKNGYETIFGPDTFNRKDNFTLACDTYTYNATTKSYTITSGGCGGTTIYFKGESIINAYKYDDRIEITTAVAYYNGEDSTIYRDFEMKNKIKEFTSTENLREDLNVYVENNKDYLTQYTFTFKLGEDGFYYYVGAEKTQK